MPYDAIAEEYIRLGSAIDRHLPGYIDAYYGPPQWREQEQETPLPELVDRAASLARTLSAADTMDLQRKDYLSRQVFAMQTTLRLLQGEKLRLVDEVEALYDVRPERISESLFEEVHHTLDELLPPGENLRQRMIQRRQTLEIPVDQAERLIPVISKQLLDLTRQRFPLPDEESVEFIFVQNQPWVAYNWYLGDCRSRIEINTDLPLHIDLLANFIAHEGYPGHHTEAAVKEMRLVRQEGRYEQSMALINTPSCVIAEGIAVHALQIVMPDDALIDWHREEIYPQAGFNHLDPQREFEIDQALRNLAGLSGNAAFMLHEDGLSAEEVSAYLQHYGLSTPQEANKAVEFLLNPLFRSYIFTYFFGRSLLKDLLARQPDPGSWFGRLLTEAVTPSQVRQWLA
jgi:hypothetical protein